MSALRADRRHIAYCDIHSEDNVRFDDILRWQRNYDPHEIILNGDVVLAEYASHWNEKTTFKHIGYEQIGARLEREFKVTHALLRRIREASPKARIRWVPGNHEGWYFWVALFHPQTGVILGKAPNTKQFKTDLAAAQEALVAGILRRHFKTDELGIEVTEYHQPLRIGPLLYLHGDQFTSIASTPRFYPNTNLVIGHFHQKKITPLHDSGSGRPVQHFAVPTLMKIKRPRGYQKLKSSNHSNGFFYANVSSSGLFEGFIKDVFGDEGALFPWQI